MKEMIGYIRVSTDEQGTAGNGLEAQRTAIIKFAADNGHTLLEIVQEVASGKLGLNDRPVLNAAIKRCIKSKATLVVSKLDRLSRQAAFILNLMDTSVKFVVTQFPDADEFMLHMYAVLGEKERKMIGQRTKDALAELKRKGVKLGGPKALEAGVIGRGVQAAKANEFAEKLRPAIERMRSSGMSFQAIADEFNTHGTKTARGGAWQATTVRNMCQRFV